MEERVVEFVEVLRDNGLKVGASETRDAIAALAQVGLDHRETVQSVLAATLCKRTQDRLAFDRAFEFYFLGGARVLEGLEAALLRRIREEGLLEGDDLAMLIATMDALAGQLAPLTRAALAGDRAALAQILRQASLRLDFSRVQSALQNGFYSRRLAAEAGSEGMRADLASIEAELKARGLATEGLHVVSRHLAQALRGVEAAAKREVSRQTAARQRASPQTALGERALSQLSVQEFEVVKRAVRALAQKLKSRIVRKQRSRRKGLLNPRRTLRMSLSSGAVPMVPQFRARRPLRPDVIVLCDVSESVRTVSKLMLLFTWTLQSVFSRVRSFVFISELGEVTQLFRGLKPDAALEAMISQPVISMGSNSNYGQALSAFCRHNLGLVSRRTTVLVIGDGRNNFNEASGWALDDMRRKAKRVVWICTEPKANWGLGDSEMHGYAKRVNQVVTVQTLSDLERFAPHLISS